MTRNIHPPKSKHPKPRVAKPRPGHWLLQDAKARFSELVRKVRSEGPQHLTVHVRGELNDWLAHKIRPMFEQRVLQVTEDIMFKWRLLVEEGRKAGHTYSQPDLIIAATGLHHGLTIVSRDVADYEKARVPLFNPWKDSLLS